MADQPMPAEQATAQATADPAVSYAQSSAGLTGELASVPQTQSSITVNHDNVLQAAQVISQILQEHGASILANMPELRVDPPGKDPVSIQAANAWNARLVTDGDSYASRVREYLQSLQTVANNLAASAKQYGYSDDEIAAAFQQSGIASA